MLIGKLNKSQYVAGFKHFNTSKMKDLTVETLKEIIKNYMESKELSLRQFAKSADVSHQTVSNIIDKSDVNPSLKVIHKIIETTGHSIKIHVNWKSEIKT